MLKPPGGKVSLAAMVNKNQSERDGRGGGGAKLAAVVGLAGQRQDKRAATINGGALGGER